jgi:hypothetical protein
MVKKKAPEHFKTFSPVEIAAMVYEFDRIYCQHTEDYSKVPWINASADTKQSLILAVKDRIDNPTLEIVEGETVSNWRRRQIFNSSVDILTRTRIQAPPQTTSKPALKDIIAKLAAEVSYAVEDES